MEYKALSHHVELLLQLLVRVVDAKLFEAVDLEGFEAVDVEDADELVHLAAGAERLVDVHDDPVEDARVYALGQRVPGEQGVGLKKNRVKTLTTHFPIRYTQFKVV